MIRPRLGGITPMDDEHVSEEARRRAAQYARQPSLWAAPQPATATSSRPMHRLTQLVRTAVTAVVLLAGPPWVLWLAFGSPVTVGSSWWSTDPFTATSVSPTTGLRVAGIWAGWLVWAILATLLVGSIVGVLRGRRIPRWHLPMPLHRLVVGLTGSATVALVTMPATAALAAPPAHAAPAPDLHQSALETERRPAVSPPTSEGEGVIAHVRGDLVIVSVDRAQYDYRVRRGDTLSKIAKRWLGDPDRWPQICSLNKHRHFTGGGTLTDCDLIYPGWNLRLPDDATPPPDAAPRRPSRTPPDRAVPDRPGPSGPPSTNPAPVSPTPEAARPTHSTPPAADSADDEDRHETAGADLVLPSGSVIPWALALAITATAALVWLQRRRRYRLDADDDLQELPAPVLAAQDHIRDATGPAPAAPVLTHRLPSGGVGLVGSGADGAARGLIVTALTAGTPTEPGQRAEVIIDRRTLITLIGDPPAAAWSRLHIVDDLDQALTLLDTHLLRRARILDEHGLTDIDALRDTAPSEPALPPLLMVTDSEQVGRSNRARITFGLTTGLEVTTVVLGHWPHGPALSVSDDGSAQLEADEPESGRQFAVLDVTATRELLDTAREAHTGQAPSTIRETPAQPSATANDTGGPATALPLQASRTAGAAADTTPSPRIAERARLRVLGKARIENITADGRPLRAKALELAVFLAVHPDGASTREIGEYLEPDARLSQADQRVHTNASNLRHVLGRAGTAGATNAYVIKTAGRYRLDPATVDVDVWTLRDLMRKATIATEPGRRELLTAACELCSAPLAEDRDYEWIQPHRETVRRWGTEAHLMLAGDLLDNDPQAASDLLDSAIGMDRYNEALYVQAMHARHALGDADGVRTLLRALSKSLADLDAEPRDDTIELANTLRTSLETR